MYKFVTVSAILLLVISCKNEPATYATFEGKINSEEKLDTLSLMIAQGDIRKIPIQPDGTFSDTLTVEPGTYEFKAGNEYAEIYLKNGDVLRAETDYDKFDENLKYSGTGDSPKMSNFIISQYKLVENVLSAEAFKLPQEEFSKKLDEFKSQYENLKTEYNLPDSLVVARDENINVMLQQAESYYKSVQELTKLNGKPAPAIVLQDLTGKSINLSDYKGNYVYIDFWATWCGPCKAEIPALKKLEEKLAPENVVKFVSISVDPTKDHDKWKKFVADKELKGEQLVSPGGWTTQIKDDYQLTGIPRFVLLDPQGNIQDINASRPSNPKTEELLSSLTL